MEKLRCAIMRAGISKVVCFLENELPADAKKRDKILLRVMGSPDKKQIDGLGGAETVTSNVMIVGPPSRKDADVDCLLGLVRVSEPQVVFNAIFGNPSAAAAPFAIDEGLVRAREPVTTVRVNCRALGVMLIEDVEVKDGKSVYEGDYAIAGVPGTGSKISIDYSDTSGMITGRLLPTGNVTDILNLGALGKLEASIVDASNWAVFVRAEDLGLKGSESPEEIDNNERVIETVRAIRKATTKLVGVEHPIFPLVYIAQRSIPYTNFGTGKAIKASETDIVCKHFEPEMLIHNTYAGTAAVVTGAAAKIEGTVVNALLSKRGKTQDVVTIGHPSGTIPVEVGVSKSKGVFKLEKAKIWRTARRMMDGYVYV